MSDSGKTVGTTLGVVVFGCLIAAGIYAIYRGISGQGFPGSSSGDDRSYADVVKKNLKTSGAEGAATNGGRGYQTFGDVGSSSQGASNAAQNNGSRRRSPGNERGGSGKGSSGAERSGGLDEENPLGMSDEPAIEDKPKRQHELRAGGK